MSAHHLNNYVREVEAARTRERAIDRAKIQVLEREVQRRAEVEKGLRTLLREREQTIEELTISRDNLAHDLALARIGGLAVNNVHESVPVSTSPLSLIGSQVNTLQASPPQQLLLRHLLLRTLL